MDFNNKYKHLFIRDRLRISITNMCNMSCYYCHNEGQGHGNYFNFIPLEFIINLAEFIIVNNVYINKINITGGEPLLHPKILEIVRILSPICQELRLNTNGMLLDEKLILQLKKAGLGALKIGVDSIYNDQSKPNLKNQKQNIDTLVGNISFANSIMKTSINTVVTHYNYDKIDDMINFAIESNLSRIKLIELINYDFWGNHMTNSENSEYFQTALDKYSKQSTDIRFDKLRGRHDIILNNDFLLRCCEDYCKLKACANLYTIISSDMKLVMCQKLPDSTPISFNNSFEEINARIIKCNQSICNNKDESYPRDNIGNLVLKKKFIMAKK